MRLNSSKQPQAPVWQRPLKIGTHRLHGHLLAAVEHVDRQAHRATEILRGLRLARAGRAGGRATHHQSQRLRERDVAAVSEWVMTSRPWCRPRTRTLYLKVASADLDQHSRVSDLPKAHLRLPGKRRRPRHLALDQLGHHVAIVQSTVMSVMTFTRSHAFSSPSTS